MSAPAAAASTPRAWPLDAAVCRGTLRHRRFVPAAHEFAYPLFLVLLDIDAIGALAAKTPLLSHNRWNWASFRDRDYLDGQPGPLRARLAEEATRQGLALPDGRVLLLTHLRYLGYAFNPVSFYFCHDAADVLQLVVAEVNNTYGGRHCYWLIPQREDVVEASSASAALPRAGADRATRFTATATKALYVSPFMTATADYGFAFSLSPHRLVVHMTVEATTVTLFDATLSLAPEPWSAGALARALWRFPWMTARVVAAIHYQAARLWLKGLRVVPRAHPRGLFTKGHL